MPPRKETPPNRTSPRQLVVSGLLAPDAVAALERVMERLPERRRLSADRVMEPAPYTPWEVLRACLWAVDRRRDLRLLAVAPDATHPAPPKRKGGRFMRSATP